MKIKKTLGALALALVGAASAIGAANAQDLKFGALYPFSGGLALLAGVSSSLE